MEHTPAVAGVPWNVAQATAAGAVVAERDDHFSLGVALGRELWWDALAVAKASRAMLERWFVE